MRADPEPTAPKKPRIAALNSQSLPELEAILGVTKCFLDSANESVITGHARLSLANCTSGRRATGFVAGRDGQAPQSGVATPCQRGNELRAPGLWPYFRSTSTSYADAIELVGHVPKQGGWQASG